MAQNIYHIKILIYLQDHFNNKDGLKLVSKSHSVRNIDSKNYIQIKQKIGDIVIFDQRITQRSMDKQCDEQRILVSFGFGKIIYIYKYIYVFN